MNKEPRKLSIPIDGEEVEFDRYHASLYTYLGSCALGLPLSTYDHVFLIQEEEIEEETRAVGIYLFNYEEIYPAVKAFIEQNGYPQHTNCPIIDPNDVKMFEVYTSAPEEIPEDWM